MKKLISALLILSQILSPLAYAGKIQNEDVKSLAELTSAGATSASLINDTKIYVSSLGEQLSTAISNGDIGGASAGGINYVTNYKAQSLLGWSSCNEQMTFTVTIASPAVFTTSSAHGFQIGQAMTFSTTGVLPTGLTTTNTYYVVAVPSSTTFQVSSTLGGSPVNTSGSQSGTNVLYPASPISCSGGTLAGLTFTNPSSTSLRYNNVFQLTQSNSTRVQGQGANYAFTIANADQAKMISVSFDYNASNTFVASSGQTGSDSDIEVFMYDVTNAQLIPMSPKVIVANGANNFTYKGTFQSASNSTSYKLIIYTATNNANAVGWTFKFVNVMVGPQGPSSLGAPITDWVPYNLVIGGVTTAPTPGSSITLNQAKWRRVGDSMEIHYDFFQTSAGSAGSGAYLFPLPSGYSIDGNKIDITQGSNLTYNELAIVGIAQNYPTQSGHMAVYNATNLSMFTAGNFVGVGGNGTLNNATIRMTFQALVPIAGWASTTTLSQDYDGRVVAASIGQLANQSYSANVPLTFTSVNFDTHSGWNGSNTYTVPVSGIYEVGIEGLNTTTANSDFFLYVNGSFYQAIAFTASGSVIGTGTVKAKLKAGDALTIVSNGSGTLFYAANTYTPTFTINRISGSATIAASEKVIAKYRNTTNFTSSTTVPINFDTKVTDTHSAVNTSSSAWKFTAPRAGTYIINGTIGTTGASSDVKIYLNGSSYEYVGVTYNTYTALPYGTQVTLNAGDYIDIRLSPSVSTNGSTAGSTYINISSI